MFEQRIDSDGMGDGERLQTGEHAECQALRRYTSVP